MPLDPNVDRDAEWHPGPPVGRFFPEEIHVAACKRCGLRAGQDWQNCTGGDGFRHDMRAQIYVPAEVS